MSLSSGLRAVATLIEESQQFGEIRDVKFPDAVDSAETEEFEAEIDLAVSLCSATSEEFRPVSSRVDADGSITLSFESERSLFTTGRELTGIAVDHEDAMVEADGTVVISLLVTAAPDGSDSEGRTRIEAAASEGGGGDECGDAIAGPDDRPPETEERLSDESADHRETPPFRDVELLTEIYESCETFAEMRAELGMDVSTETVRRYMIDYGIHEPSSYDTADERSEPDDVAIAGPAEALESYEGPVLPDIDEIADRTGLADRITAEELIESVQRSTTVFEFQREMDIEYDEARTLLTELNLCDFVTGRMSSHPRRDTRRNDVVERLQESAG